MFDFLKKKKVIDRVKFSDIDLWLEEQIDQRNFHEKIRKTKWKRKINRKRPWKL